MAPVAGLGALSSATSRLKSPKSPLTKKKEEEEEEKKEIELNKNQLYSVCIYIYMGGWR